MKALIAMSGGVDSSVAAWLMQKNGYSCIGATMKLYENCDVQPGASRTCCSLDDVEDARAVARRLGFPFYVFNYKDMFREKVMDRFAAAYMRGETPNPCIDCNRFLKFGGLFRRAMELGCDKIATGHYARVFKDPVTGRFGLKKGLDPQKDQSYVLYSLTQEELSHTCFPLGAYTKAECRAMAESLGLINAKKKESQDICFVPDGNYRKFIENYTGTAMPPGNFVDTSGRILGRHGGICNYTIGQRKGLGLALGRPVFVKEIRPGTNEVVLADDCELFTCSLVAGGFNWLSVSADYMAAHEDLPVQAKIRYRHSAAAAHVKVLPGDRVQITFEEPQRAATKGQAAVIYSGDTVLGGGTIIET